MMKLTAERVFAAVPVIDQIVAEKRPLTVKGAYRMARLLAKLLPEFRLIEQQRDALILAYGYMAPPEEGRGGADPVPTVPPDKVDEFRANLDEILKHEIEVEVQPVPLSTLGPADAESPVTAADMLALGELLVDDLEEPPAALDLPQAA